MVAVTLEGRLGNQLFQYAFIYSTAKKLNTRFYIDTSVIDFILPQYFDIKTDNLYIIDKYIFSISGFKNIFNYHLRIAFYNLLKKMYGLKELIYDNNLEPLKQLKSIQHKALYKGFFQSEDYFINHKNDIIDLFKIKHSHRTQFEALIDNKAIPKSYVAVHIRRGDYVDHNMALSYEYFHRAIESIHHEDNYYVFVSDEPANIEKEFKYLKHKYISDNDEIIDFQLIMHGGTCILSNSTFSWWAAYLNTKQPKIIAPQYWLGKADGKELPVKVIPNSWIKFN